jgi:hypothetical protein
MIKRLVMDGIFCTIKAVEKKHPKTHRIGSTVSHGLVAVFLFAIVVPFAMVEAASYTDKQLEALATRVGQVFWIASVDNRTPTFLSTPAPNASSFPAPANESFEITELVGWKAKNPYYKVRFDSGKEGYIRPEMFHEEFNMTILTVDPQADAKKKAVQGEEDNKQRIAWIQSQPWSETVKQEAINGRAVPGMNVAEVKRVLGSPVRVIKGRSGQKAQSGIAEERWLYAGGTELVFHNNLLIRVESKEKKEP